MNAAAIPTPAGAEQHAEIARIDQELRAATSVQPQDPMLVAAALEKAVDACRRWPGGTSGVFYLEELLGELADVYELLGRPDDALATMQAAISAGYRGAPDPRCRLAEILLRAGRAQEAHQIFVEVKAETPDDVWLFNNAGLEYGASGDHDRAVAWLTEGLELAIRTGDPERLVAQMSDLRRASLEALGRDLDELETRADDFLAEPPVPRRLGKSDELPVISEALAPAKSSTPAAAASPPASSSGSSHRLMLALSWFPRHDFDAALEAWPQLADDWGTSEHTEYNRRLQRRLAEMRAAAQRQMWIAPIHIDQYRRWCARTGNDPATSASRSGYAAELASTASAELIAWPPPRNAPCWCASGRKYKQCCGHPSVTTGPAVQ